MSTEFATFQDKGNGTFIATQGSDFVHAVLTTNDHPEQLQQSIRQLNKQCKLEAQAHCGKQVQEDQSAQTLCC